ncbi:MAG: adenine phosphoribosyltransferase [Eubacterium sp.]|nr:adenine phosphoribosyltransferase [Eubacterium sp.]
MQEALKLKENERKALAEQVDTYVRSIPDFPEPGIIFRDVTTVIQDAEGLVTSVEAMEKVADYLKEDVDAIVGLESRGFIFGMPIAKDWKKGFIPVRKKGKLPCETISQKYDLEYGQAEIEIHTDAIKPGQKVLIVDDLIATGGTIEASIKLIEQLGGEVVGCLFLIELAGLKGREKLKNYNVEAVVTYDGK